MMAPQFCFLKCCFLFEILNIYSRNICAMCCNRGVPGGASGKGPACQCRRSKRAGSIPGQEDPLEEDMATESHDSEPGGL